MGKIVVVTDSTADLPKELLVRNNIQMVPLQVRVGDCEYKDRIDIMPFEFLNKLEEMEEMPVTSQPPIGDFVQLYEELAQEYDHIISIHFSEKMSGTVKTARLAAKMIEDVDIRVVDSETVTAPLGMMVIEVAGAVKKGRDIEEIMDLIDELKKKIKIYFTMDNLTYLEKGGRIGKATAFLGNLFNVRPLLTIENGEITPYKRIRGERRLYRTIEELVERDLNGKQGYKVIILYGKYLDKANKLKEVITNKFDWEEVEMMRFGSVVGAHIGPTPFGVIFHK